MITRASIIGYGRKIDTLLVLMLPKSYIWYIVELCKLCKFII